MKLDRQQQLWALIGLTALTMAPQYAMQGWQALGGNLLGLGDDFPVIDAVAWALRAIIEAWALIYLFSTPAKNERQARVLAGFEIALIVLIVVTLGPALAAAGSNKSMLDYLGKWYSAWNFAVASYAPLMLGAAGFAFKVESEQSDDTAFAKANETIEQLNTRLQDSEQRFMDSERQLAGSEQARLVSEQETDGLRTTINDLRAQLNATETELKKAVKPLNGKTETALRLFGDDKQDRIRAAHESWPKLPQRSLAIIADSSPAYVNQTLAEPRTNGNGRH